MAADIHILVPAFNEGPRIGEVLETICSYPQNKRIAVIDDGSTDNTQMEASRFPVDILTHPKNLGKGAALQTGLDHLPDTPYWLFLDADLIGLDHDHMDQLLEPLYRKQEVAMTVGMLVGHNARVNAAQRWFGILNGQRGLSGRFVESLPSLNWSKFGVEIYLSKLARARGCKVCTPVLQNLTHYTKEQKLGLGPGVRYRLQMYNECLYSYFHWRSHTPAGLISKDSRKPQTKMEKRTHHSNP